MPHPQRRQLIIDRMNELESQGFHCQGCAGNCCTFEANSMMITPLEAIELLSYLREEKLANDELKAKCQDTIRKFRLDQMLSTGRGSLLRRTYTCPFFGHSELGCPLPRSVKPFGCLAFNAHHADEKAGGHCYSETEVLIKREKLHPEEDDLNKKYQATLKLSWEKAPIPVALLDIWDKELP
jgi:Fe-S-cluster containining protein